MGTHISLLDNIYSYGSYPGYILGSTSPPLPTFLDNILELFQELVLNNRLHFRLLWDHFIGMRLIGMQLIGITLISVHLVGMHLIGVNLISVCRNCRILITTDVESSIRWSRYTVIGCGRDVSKSGGHNWEVEI